MRTSPSRDIDFVREPADPFDAPALHPLNSGTRPISSSFRSVVIPSLSPSSCPRQPSALPPVRLAASPSVHRYSRDNLVDIVDPTANDPGALYPKTPWIPRRRSRGEKRTIAHVLVGVHGRPVISVWHGPGPITSRIAAGPAFILKEESGTRRHEDGRGPPGGPSGRLTSDWPYRFRSTGPRNSPAEHPRHDRRRLPPRGHRTRRR